MTHNSPVVLPRLFDDTVDRDYIDRLVRALEQALIDIDSVRPLIGSTLQLTSLPVTGNSLRDGSVFSDNGDLKIVLANTGYASTYLATSSVGDVTITTA